MMEKNNINVNINNLAIELSELIGQHIGVEHIYPSTEGRHYYIQAPKAGAPMLLHHYRGAFFIDMHPDDFENISSGKVPAHDYITSSNWQVGYFWGGGSMISGGYYQPLDIIGRKDEVRRYLQILSCRGNLRSSGYIPSESKCSNCSVENCPFSKYKTGNWDAEKITEKYDPRLEFFEAICTKFEQENPGYTIRGFCCGKKISDKEIWLNPNRFSLKDEPLSLMAYASNSLIRSLLMHETKPNDYAKDFKFRIYNIVNKRYYTDVTEETLEKAFEELGYIKKATTQPEEISEKKVPLMTQIRDFFKKIF